MVKKTNYNIAVLGFSVLTVLILSTASHGTDAARSSGDGIKGNKRMKIWIRNMNFDNPDNWDGLVGNCGNIYSFGGWVEASVITFPKSVSSKNIILPQNGYIVLQSGLTTFTESTCPPREAIWKRHSALDWFDPANWRNDKDNLTVQNEAIAHVERVPCQFDSVKFKGNSSFSILISGDVSVRSFIVGNETLTYAEVALMMSTELGSVQFKKKPETKFDVNDATCDESSSDCVCDNYKEPVKRRICSLVDCPVESSDDKCPYPVTPNGFCCPICGIVLKITHKDGLSLQAVRSKLKSELQTMTNAEQVDNYVTRYKEGVSHIVLVPRMVDRNVDLGGLVKRMKAYLTADSEVTDVSIRKSWDSLDDAGGSTSSELTGTAIASVEIVIVILFVLIGAAVFTLYWKKIGIPQMPFTCPPCPTFSSVRMPSQFLSSTGSSSSFAFARFSNERISHLNLGPSFEGSSISRAETVDDDVNSTRKSSVAPQVLTAELIAVDEADETDEANLAKAKDLAQDSQNFSEETEHVYDLIEMPGEPSSAISTVGAGSTLNLLKSEE